jgi:hypothetical protein
MIVAKLETRRLDYLIANNEAMAEQIIASTAKQAEAYSKDMAPVDTGALKNSLLAEPLARLLWWLHDGVLYGIYQEFGTYKMAAQPFMIPAIERVRGAWNKAWRDLFRQ